MTTVPELLERLAPWPEADFAEFGPVSVQPLSRFQTLTGAFLGRNWVAIPHVTHNDGLDVTEAERWREAWNQANPDSKLTPVALLVKTLALALADFPTFNASLTADGKSLVLKQYAHIGVAVDTPQGLLVAVVRDCDRKAPDEINGEIRALAQKARTKGLSMAEMSGSSMTVSSLGHIGGTSFSPIVNAPDVAILGALKIQDRPSRGENDAVEWRQVMPVSLSYDHRVINGADAARFTRRLADILADPEASFA